MFYLGVPNVDPHKIFLGIREVLILTQIITENLNFTSIVNDKNFSYLKNDSPAQRNRLKWGFKDSSITYTEYFLPRVV